MSTAITSVDKRFADKNPGILYLALICNLSNQRTTILHAKNWFKVARNDGSNTVFFGRPGVGWGRARRRKYKNGMYW